MSRSDNHREVAHEIIVDVSAADVYRLLADVRHWPQIFPPTIHAERVEQDGDTERIRIWATANDEVRTWTSRRELDPRRHRIAFRQEITQPPVAEMGGEWIIEESSPGHSRVRLLHDYRAIDDDFEKLAWLDRAVDTNSRTELAALKRNLEATAGAAHRTFSFEDSVVVRALAKDVYDFLANAQAWEEALPHVARVVLTEPSQDLQILRMDTRMADGSQHTTESVRVCFPHERIVYKQTTLPALMTLHTGYWQVVESPAGDGSITVTSQHTVSINEENIARVLGADADLERARAFVRKALGGNSSITLQHAKEHAEASR